MKTKSLVWATCWMLSLFIVSTTAGATGYTLTVSAQGSGIVTRNPTNITYPSGVTVSVLATPAAGWYFANWSGDASGSVNPLDVTMNANLAITGNFLPYPAYTLTLVTNGQGTIALSPTGSSYLSNTVVTATATPAAGWVFTGWSGDTNSSANPLPLTLNTNLALTGSFAQLPAFDVTPASVTNAVGSTVSFTSHALGTAPLTYQWFFINGALPNAAGATLALTNTTLSQVGNYWVIATNLYGSATSSVAMLTLTNAGGSTNMVNTADEAVLRAAIAKGGWVGLGFNGPLTLTNTITITNQVILDGKNVAAIISGGNAVRLFYVAPGASLTATNLTLADGNDLITSSSQGTNAEAGAIYNDGGYVMLFGCTLTNNNAQSLIYGGLARGGAIFNNGGTVLLSQCALLNNAVVGGGYNSLAQFTINTALGGAIYTTNGWVTIAGGRLSSNVCQSVCGSYYGTGLAMGGALFQASGELMVTKSAFTFNQTLGGTSYPSTPTGPASPAYGGALAASGGSLTIAHSQFSTNRARGGDAGYYNQSGSASGGAVYSAATLCVVDSSFAGNQSASGQNNYNGGREAYAGAIYNLGSATLNRCSIYANSVQGGNALATMGSAVHGGAGFGGGIFNASLLAATNCTIALNSVGGGFGDYTFLSTGVSGNGFGGGIFNNTNATLNAMNLTIASNLCISPAQTGSTNGLALGTQLANTNGILSLHNCLIAGTNSNVYGPITDDGYNFCSDATAQFSGGSSFNNTNPKLAPLADYGGTTLCMALLPDSPAIDYAGGTGLPDTDQRGFVRPFGDGPDSGAYEYGSYQPNMPLALNLSVKGNTLQLAFTALATNVYRLQMSTDLHTWSDLNTNGPFAGDTILTHTINPQDYSRCFFRLLKQ